MTGRFFSWCRASLAETGAVGGRWAAALDAVPCGLLSPVPLPHRCLSRLPNCVVRTYYTTRVSVVCSYYSTAEVSARE